MRSPEKLVLLAKQVARSTDCYDSNEIAIVECCGLQASTWLIYPRGMSNADSFTVLLDGMREERNGFLPVRVADLAAAGWNGVMVLADLLAPDFPEVL